MITYQYSFQDIVSITIWPLESHSKTVIWAKLPIFLSFIYHFVRKNLLFRGTVCCQQPEKLWPEGQGWSSKRQGCRRAGQRKVRYFKSHLFYFSCCFCTLEPKSWKVCKLKIARSSRNIRNFRVGGCFSPLKFVASCYSGLSYGFIAGIVPIPPSYLTLAGTSRENLVA